MRRRRLRRFLLWSFLLLGSVATGSVWFAYTYITDSDTLAQFIREAAPRYLPKAQVSMDRVQIRPLVGDVELRQTSIWQTVDGKTLETLKIPWLQIRSDFRALFWGKVATREVAVAWPRLRIKRRADGTWNLQDLLASPWPGTAQIKPVITISKGSVELDEGSAFGTILREVSLKIEPISDGSFRFEGDARSDMFERMALAGTYHPTTGRMVLTQGRLSGLAISDTLRNRLPQALREKLAQMGLDRGEVDVNVARLVIDPQAPTPVDYEVALSLREGLWDCPKMPFPLSKVAGSATITPRSIRVHQADGYNGKTVVRLSSATFSPTDLATGPMDMRVKVVNLDLDERLKKKTPPKLYDLWGHFSPPGRTNLGQVNATIHAFRHIPGTELLYETDVDVLDVAIEYHQFKYPLEHLRGKLHYKEKKITVDLATVVGSEPLTGVGTIVNPGPGAVVDIRFEAGTMPVDEVLLRAIPPDARKVVEDFQPKGTVRGVAVLKRTPLPDDPKGKIAVDAELDLNPGCSIRWKGLPYPVSNLTGRLGLHPDRWVFTDMQGENNLARISASGEVNQVTKGKFAVDLKLKAEGIPFDRQLRESLPPAWGERTWSILNPTGSSTVDALISVGPGKPDDYKITITPGTDACVSLKLTPAPGTETAAHSPIVELPDMEKVTGTFFFDNGVVSMKDVGFRFRQAPVHFNSGKVTMKDTGAFTLSVQDLWVKDLRLEYELRKIMPPAMADFAAKLDDGKTFTARGNMTIGWSGAVNDPAVCSWNQGRVVFNDNTIAAGLPLEHIQGEIHNIAGRFDGRALTSVGILNLGSVKIGGQHLTNVTSPLSIDADRARVTSLESDLLGGKLNGSMEVTLTATPEYKASFRLVGAQLEELASTVPGRQDYKGEISGKVEVSGLGQNLKTVTGKGEAHVTHGDNCGTK